MRKFTQIVVWLFAFNAATGQTEPFNIGIQINPIFHFNKSVLSDPTVGRMQRYGIGAQTGIEFNFRISDKLTIVPTFRYYRRVQKNIEDQFWGYLNNGSTIWQRYYYGTTDFGIGAKYKLLQHKHSSVLATIGASYSYLQLNGLGGGYHLHGDNPKTVHLGSIDYGYSPDEVGTSLSMFVLSFGVRRVSTIKRVGVFEYGLDLYVPTGNMPEYSFSQSLLTDDAGRIDSKTTFKSRQYSIGTSIVYHMFNFNKKWKLVRHNKSDRGKKLRM